MGGNDEAFKAMISDKLLLCFQNVSDCDPQPRVVQDERTEEWDGTAQSKKEFNLPCYTVLETKTVVPIFVFVQPANSVSEDKQLTTILRRQVVVTSRVEYPARIY